MSTERKPKCIHCGRGEADHLLANYADGPHVGAAVLICPKSTYVASTWEFLPEPMRCPSCGHDHAPGRKCNTALKTPGCYCGCRSRRARVDSRG
jgi:hypothetical protein